MEAFSTGALSQHPPSPPKGSQLSILLPFRCCPAARGVVSSYLQCWRKDRLKLCRFGGIPRTDGAGAGQSFRISGLDGKVIDDLSLLKCQILWPTKNADGAES